MQQCVFARCQLLILPALPRNPSRVPILHIAIQDGLRNLAGGVYSPWRNSVPGLGRERRYLLQGYPSPLRNNWSLSLSPSRRGACPWQQDLPRSSRGASPCFLWATGCADASPDSLLPAVQPRTAPRALGRCAVYTWVWCCVSMKGMCRLARLSSPTLS